MTNAMRDRGMKPRVEFTIRAETAGLARCLKYQDALAGFRQISGTNQAIVSRPDYN